ncbi:MAG: HAD family hydrolase [Ruminococcaceae bacterium]|nr:HAD family hydrolase [Oscillospiraceae bacterium]
MIKALIFDLDGTLAHTLPAIAEGMNLALAELGYPAIDEARVYEFINLGARDYAKMALPAEYREDDGRIDALYAAYNRNYAGVYMHTNTTYDGIPQMIAHLGKKYPMAVNSNKQDEFVKALVAQLFEQGTFVAAEGFRKDRAPKPDPAVPLQLAALMGAAPEECAYIGDSDVDVRTALNAGMHAIDVCWGYRPEQVLYDMGAEMVAHSPEELVRIIEEFS